MSKNLNKSVGGPGGTPKNTLFNYFTKSPATSEKKKMSFKENPKMDVGVEKENVENGQNIKKERQRCLDSELRETMKESEEKEDEVQQKIKDENDEDEPVTGSKRKRRRIVLQDSDSSENESPSKKDKGKGNKYNFDSDGSDDEYKVSDVSSEDSMASEDLSNASEDLSNASNDDDDDDEVNNRRSSSKQVKKKRKLNSNGIKFERTNGQNSDGCMEKSEKKLKMEADSLSILEKLKSFQEDFQQDAIKNEPSDNKYDDLLLTTNDEGYDEPVVWPHQKLEFLQPDKIKDKEGRRPDHPDYDPSTLYVPPSFLNGLSPGVRQWWVLKSDNYDCVLFFKVGKFYELYHMDADVGVHELGFTYMRGEFAHSGFPEVSFDKMASILVDRGYKIARVEQTETPDMMTERCKKIKATKFDKVVRREICQITNRGTQVFGSQCQVTANYEPNYMLAVVEKNEGATSRYGICYIDTSIGDFYIGEFTDDKSCSRLLTLLSHHMPVLVITERSSLTERTQQIWRAMLVNVLKEQLTSQDAQRCSADNTLKHLAEKYYAVSVDNWPAVLHAMQEPGDRLGLTPNVDYILALKALGMCIGYLNKCCLEEKIMPMARYNFYIPPDIANIEETTVKLTAAATKKTFNKHMVLDATTLLHLHITGEDHSLLSTIDQCCTKFGKRLLHHWICAPSCDCGVIKERQEAISELLDNPGILQNMRALLAPLPDFERQLAQIHLFGNKLVAESHPDGRAILFEEKQYDKKKLNNFIALLGGLKTLNESIPKMFKDCKSNLLRRLTQNPKVKSEEEGETEDQGGIYPNMQKQLRFFETSFDHKKAAESGVIAPEKGLDEDYDATIRKIESVQRKLNDYLAEQEAYFGCRLSYFGHDKKRYQLEVPESKTKKAGPDYQLEGQRKSSNPVKRYTTEVTRDLLKQMQNAEDDRNRVLKDLARRIFEKFSNEYAIWKQCVDCIANLDVIGSLAEYARNQPVMCVPNVLPANDEPFIDIDSGYHPCMSMESYIPNGLQMGTGGLANLALLSGPNMGGKSTFMRQVGLLLVMGQIGSHVPADRCEFTIIDRIFSRLGAQDDILAGQSTFMVEMSEASLILKHATKNSFVLMDELGRGTATYDGTAIAAAVVNFLADLGCRSLFSTHYKNLTDNFANDSRVQLGHMACMVENEGTEDPTEENVTFLYKFIPGACPKSYGFNAAKLAGMPHAVIKRAYELSKDVEATALKRKIESKIVTAAVKNTDSKELVEEIKDLLLQLRSCRV